MIHYLGFDVNLPDNWEVHYDNKDGVTITVGDVICEFSIKEEISTIEDLRFIIASIDRRIERKVKKRYGISFVKAGFLLEDKEYSAHGFGQEVHQNILRKMISEGLLGVDVKCFSKGDLELYIETFNIKDNDTFAHQTYGYFREFIKDYEEMPLNEVIEMVEKYNDFLIEFPIFQS